MRPSLVVYDVRREAIWLGLGAILYFWLIFLPLIMILVMEDWILLGGILTMFCLSIVWWVLDDLIDGAVAVWPKKVRLIPALFLFLDLVHYIFLPFGLARAVWPWFFVYLMMWGVGIICWRSFWRIGEKLSGFVVNYR